MDAYLIVLVRFGERQHEERKCLKEGCAYNQLTTFDISFRFYHSGKTMMKM